MKVFVVTGRIAEEGVKRAVSELVVDVEVCPLPVSVASFITPEYAAEALRNLSLRDYDLILMPGSVRGDVSPVEEATGVPTFKGPTDLNDLPLVLSNLKKIELSRTVSATELITDLKAERTRTELRHVEENWREILEEQGGFIIGGDGREVPVGGAFPMRVIAEIVNAPTMDLEAVRRRAAYYEFQGADVVDIGMLAGSPDPDAVEGLVAAVREATDLPVSIDTLDPSEIRVAVDAGVDLVLSVDRGNMADVAPYVLDVPVVILPSNMREGVLPHGAEERFIALMETIQQARSVGIMKIIADPVLEPALRPGLLESLRAYQLFRTVDQETPMLFGLGNVIELIDADSTGVNGILAALAAEVGADLLFVPEYSPKAVGSVREAVAASRMMYLAERRGTPPKDLGVDLLVLKEKRRSEKPYDPGVEEGVEIVEAVGDDDLVLDDMGWFVIRLDREEGLIAVVHYRARNEPDLVVKGREARDIYQTILRRGLVGRLDHAAYLGKELLKAETALNLGKSYVQDGALF